MKDVYGILGVLIPTLAAFGRLMWLLGGVQARLAGIERTLIDHTKALRGLKDSDDVREARSHV